MPSKIPVPSKGALKALRTLALGTSCTIAFSVGVITEDRRRRIHSAREVQENAKKLKASRNYHSGGLSSLPVFEEEVARYGHFGPVVEGESPRAVELRWSETPPQIRTDQEEPSIRRKRKKMPATSTPPSNTETSSPIGESKAPKAVFGRTDSSTSVLQQSREARRSNSIESQNTQSQGLLTTDLLTQELATKREDSFSIDNSGALELPSDIRSILDGLGDVKLIDSALGRFRQLVLNPLRKQTLVLDENILVLTRRVITACSQHCRFWDASYLLCELLKLHPLDEDALLSFQPDTIIQGLLSECGFQGRNLGRGNKGMVENATKLFLARLQESSKFYSPLVLDLGVKLCTVTWTAKLYDSTVAIFWRLHAIYGEQAYRCCDKLILASFARKKYEDAVQLYHRFLPQMQIDQTTFYETTNVALRSALIQDRPQEAVALLVLAGNTAKTYGLESSAYWFLQSIGQLWRERRDLSAIKLAFDNLAPAMDTVNHPVAVYAAMIQFCVESGEEDQAAQYLKNLEQKLDRKVSDTRISGHFALAKAMRGDWIGVEKDFAAMNQSRALRVKDYNAVFTPILKLYSSTHSIDETEHFLATYVDVYGIRINEYAAHTMVAAYVKNKEVDALSRWLQLCRNYGLKVTSATFNLVFKSCWNLWHVRYDLLLNMYERAKALDCGLVDDGTLSILRQAATETNHTQLPRTRLEKLEVHSIVSDPTSGNGILQEMQNHISAGHPENALHVYRQAKLNNIKIGSSLVSMAVKAALQTHDVDGFAMAADIIRDARANQHDITAALSPLLCAHISEMDLHGQDISYMVRKLCTSLEAQGLEVTMLVATHAASRLIDHGRVRQAIGLWTALLDYNGPEQKNAMKSTDLVALSVLLKGFLILRDHRGLQWVLQTLHANDIVPDARFKQKIKNARYAIRKHLAQYPHDHEAQAWSQQLEDCYKQVVGKRSHLASEITTAQRKALAILQVAIKEQEAQTAAAQDRVRETTTRKQKSRTRQW
jgi:hypothetical protein